MGDQLISCDNLLSNILLFTQDEHAERRVNPLSIRRCLGPHKLMMASDGWEASVYKRLHKLAYTHIRAEIDVGVVGGSPYREDPPNPLRGNYSVWMILDKLWEDIARGHFVDKGLYRRFSTRFNSSVSSAIYRSGVSSTRSESAKFSGPLMDNSVIIAQISMIEAVLWEMHTYRARELNSMVQAAADDDSIKHGEYIHKELPADLKIGLDMVIMGPLVYLKYKGMTTIVTKVHFERICKMLRTFSSVAVSFPAMDLKVPYVVFVDMLFSAVLPIVEEDVDFLGECLKGAKAIIVASLDTDNIPGKSLVQGYCDAIKPNRRRKSRYLASFVRSVSKSTQAAANLTNIFKSFPHPDANMYDLFESIKGVRSPNQVDHTLVPRFVGTLRRSIFSSLSLQNYDIRVKSLTPGGAGDTIAKATYATRKQHSLLRTYAASSWADTAFEHVRNFLKFEKIEVKPSSKSSQLEFDFDSDDLNEAIEYMAGSNIEEPEILSNARTINDAVSDLTGESCLNPAKAIEKFIKVVDLHEKFESQFPGMCIDDIPARDLARFVESTPDARYLVGTEPKFGEIHKKVTRMFYMAQQYLKVITQMLERYTKQICRKQPGVSITKSYAARRKDLENFCHSMTGNSEMKKAVYVSFDMSEFSKKFPMELVRQFGTVLAELSGHDWMRRIDLVFRASVVIHNSRGFFSRVSGVKGGFEGFFNFIWSSIHVTIMEMALESMGLQGETLVYSDDGILMFYCPSDWTNEEIFRRVKRIQVIYARMGLNFHLGKSMVSFSVWEYLGDICHHNHLLPMWLKEVASVTRNVKNRGLEPFYSKVKTIQAQCDAGIIAGAPPLHMFVLKRYFFGCLLDRLGIPHTPQLEELLSLIPTSAGGLRITSPFESAFLGTIEKDAEIIADMVLLRKIDPGLSDVIVSGISESLKIGGDVSQAVISGSRLVTSHPDVSGMKCINDCIDLIMDSGKAVKKFPNNPMDAKFKRELVKLLTSLENVNLHVISDFLFSMPTWTEYTNSMAVIRSSGVLRLAPRRAIARLQAEDTKRVRESIDMWYDYLNENINQLARQDPDRLIVKAEGRVLKGISVARMRPSPRLVLSEDKGEDGIHVSVEFVGGKTYSELIYTEPRIRLSKDETALAWSSEGVTTSTTRSMRQFMNSVARLLAYSPESEGAMINIARLLGIEIPPIPPGIVRSSHRKGGAQGRNVDAKLFLPRWFTAESRSRYYGSVIYNVYEMERADRTSYLEAARALAYFKMTLTNRLDKVPDVPALDYRFSFPSELAIIMHANVPMTMSKEYRPKIPVDYIGKDLIREYQSSYVEFVKSGDQQDSFADSAFFKTDPAVFDREMIREIYVTSIKTWLVASRHNSKMTLLNSLSTPLPRVDTASIILDAVVLAALSLMDPRSRRKLLDHVHNWRAKLSELRVATVGNLSLPDYVITSDPYRMFVEEITELLFIISENAPDELPAIYLGPMAGASEKIMTRLIKYADNMNLLTVGRIVVIRGGMYSPTKISPAHQTAYREAFTATLSTLYSLCRELRWDKDMIKKKLKVNMDPDDLITCTIIGRSLLRASEHRGVMSPYNRKSGVIETYKFFRLVHVISSHTIKCGENDVEFTPDELEEFITNFRLSDSSCRELKGRLMLGDDDSDHIRMLDAPLLPDLAGRIREYARGASRGVFMGGGHSRNYYYDANEIDRINHSFYQKIMHQAASSIVEYSSELEGAVLDTFNPSTPSLVESFAMETSLMNTSGDTVDLDEAAPDDHNDIMRLLKMHTKDLCIRSFVKGLKPAILNSGGTSSYPGMLASEFYDREGLTIAMSTDKVANQDAVNFWVYAMEYDDPMYALSDFILISRGGRSSVSIVKVVGKDIYLVAGVSETLIEHVPIRFMEEPPVKLAVGVTPDMLIPEVSLGTQANHIKAMAEMLTVRSSHESHAFDRMKMIVSRARRVDRRSQAVESEVMLLAAYNLLNESPSNDVIFGAYIGILMWLRGSHDIQDVARYSIAIDRKLTSSRESDKMRILVDVANTAQWLAQSNLSAGVNINDAEIRAWMGKLSEVTIRFRVPPSGVIAALRTVAEVDKSVEVRVNLLGNISQHLYVTEELKAIGWIERQLSADEEEKVNELLVDL